MRHLVEPLDLLQRTVAAFVRAPEKPPALVVTVDDLLHDGACQLVMSQVWHPANRAPFFLLDAPFEAGKPGWGERAEALRALYGEQRSVHSSQAVTLPDLAQPEDPDPLIQFTKAVQAIQSAFTASGSASGPRTHGILILLAPAAVQVDPEGQILAPLVELVQAKELGATRWILFEPALTGKAATRHFAEALRGQCSEVACRIDPVQRERDTEALLASMARPPAPGCPPGGARPEVDPPPHPGDPPSKPASPEEAAFVPALLDAIGALRKGDPDAGQKFQRASGVAAKAERPSEEIELQVLAGMLLGQKAIREGEELLPAAALLSAATERAKRASQPVQGAKAQMVLGSLYHLAGDGRGAAASFRQSADLAGEAKVPELRFLALRLGGELALEAKLRPLAEELWGEAVDCCSQADPARTAGVVEALRGLADLAQKHGVEPIERRARADRRDGGMR